MRVLFGVAISYPFIGVMSISAVLKKAGHETKLKIFNISNPQSRDIKEIRDFKPDVLAFPTYTGWHKPIRDFCRKYKQIDNVITVLGGPHPTYCPDIVSDDAIDYVCVGEGEVSFLSLIENLDRKWLTTQINGIWHKQGGVVIKKGSSDLVDINAIPPMDIDIYCNASEHIKQSTHREFSLSRGCPFKCSYCNEPSLHNIYGGTNLRYKSPDKAIEEILYVYDKYPFSSCAFVSDNFFIKRAYAYEFLEKYKKEVNIPFYCQMRIELVNQDISKLLKESGCHTVTLGIESGSYDIRCKLLNRQMTNDQIIKGCRILNDSGININANNMVGIPGESVDNIWETVMLNIAIKPKSSWCSIFQPYPKAKLTEELLEKGEIKEDIFDEIPASYFEKSIFKCKNTHMYVNFQRLFSFAVKYPRFHSLIKFLLNIPPPMNRLLDIFFIWSFTMYVRSAYKKSLFSAFKTVMMSAIESMNVKK